MPHNKDSIEAVPRRTVRKPHWSRLWKFRRYCTIWSIWSGTLVQRRVQVCFCALLGLAGIQTQNKRKTKHNGIIEWWQKRRTAKKVDSGTQKKTAASSVHCSNGSRTGVQTRIDGKHTHARMRRSMMAAAGGYCARCCAALLCGCMATALKCF